MRRDAGVVAMAAVIVTWVAGSGALEACNAAEMIDRARRNRDTDEYRAARDVAREFVDTDKHLTDYFGSNLRKDISASDADTVVDSGVGILLEAAQNAQSKFSGTKTVEGFREVLESTGTASHGLDTSGNYVIGGGFGTQPLRSMKEHVRLHVWETGMALMGAAPEWMENGSSGVWIVLKNTLGDAFGRYSASAGSLPDDGFGRFVARQSGSTAAPAVPSPAPAPIASPRPAPAPIRTRVVITVPARPSTPAPAAPAAPVPAPVEIIHHAG